MGYTIAQKIIKAHLRSGEMTPGSEIALKIDQTPVSYTHLGDAVAVQRSRLQAGRIGGGLLRQIGLHTGAAGLEGANLHTLGQAPVSYTHLIPGAGALQLRQGHVGYDLRHPRRR